MFVPIFGHRHHPTYVSERCPFCFGKNTKIVEDSHHTIRLGWIGIWDKKILIDKWFGKCEDCGKQFECSNIKKRAIEEKTTFVLS